MIEDLGAITVDKKLHYASPKLPLAALLRKTLSEIRIGGNKMMSNQKFPELHNMGKLVDEKVKDGVNIKC